MPNLEDFGGESPTEGDEDALDYQLRVNARLIESVRMGEAMKVFAQTTAGRAVLEYAETQLTEAFGILMRHANLRHPDAVTAHFNARVAVSTLKLFDIIIQRGNEDRESILRSDENLNNGGDHDESE